MNAFTPADSLHRLIKQAIDSGTASSLAEAEALFDGYRLCLVIGEAEVARRADQAALLTTVALARRVFLGGVTVIGPLDRPLLVPLPFGATVATAVEALGARCAARASDEIPRIVIGGGPIPRRAGFCVRTVYSGWRGGVMPAHAAFSRAENNVVPLAPMLAAALAVSEAFFFVQGKTPVAGKRPVGLSLWRPAHTDWLAPDEDAPPLRYLPSNLWLIGLGHLGQAYLWALGLLPYPQPTALSLVLQDTDIITPSTESTSILSEAAMIGIKKTRAMAAWAERRGFATTILERLFDASFSRSEDEPAIALCGLDNALGRRALDQVGFQLVIEAGLGRGHRNFRTIRLHTLPGSRTAAEIWNAASAQEDLTSQAAYRSMLHDGALDRCGVTLLAGKAVGAPFVGSVAACLVIGEVLRLLHGGQLHQLIDLNLQTLDHRQVVPQAKPPTGFNPGYVLAAHQKAVANPQAIVAA
jgi:hypothetical protein